MSSRNSLDGSFSTSHTAASLLQLCVISKQTPLKVKGLLTTIFAFLTIFSFGQKTDTLSIPSKVFGTNRQLVVYTTSDYKDNPKQFYEVIYVLDAQVHYMTDQVISTNFFVGKSFFAPIVVGLISEDRAKDFLPKNEFPETLQKRQGHLGDADKLLQFLNDEAIPLIDEKYRTLPTRVLIGHSLGATFASYCYLQKPNLFDAYIAISPNFEYDKFQFVKKFNQFKTSSISEHNFLYMCNSNEEIDFSKDWQTGRNRVIERMKKNDIQAKTMFINEDFSKTDDHSTVYPRGITNGLKAFFDYYHNAGKLIKLYESQSKVVRYDLAADRTNYMAYNFLWTHKPKEAIKVILWANKQFPDDLNIYDSMGEIYQENRDTMNALKSFHLYEQKLEAQKGKLSIEKYNELKAGVTERIKNVSSKM
jgi:predicted alpha/beta superfamily hydrolase